MTLPRRATRRIDIAHAGQTVPEAIEQLRAEIMKAKRAQEEALLVVHGYGSSGTGGAIGSAVARELPSLAELFRFKAYGDAGRDRIPSWLEFDGRRLNPGSTLLVFGQGRRDKDPRHDYRPSFRSLRKRVVVRPSPAGATSTPCAHVRRQLVSRGPDGSMYKCRQCGKTFRTQ